MEQQLLADLLMLVIFVLGGTWLYLPRPQATAAGLASRVELTPSRTAARCRRGHPELGKVTQRSRICRSATLE